jgi:formimidoylglutamate deiminase
MKIEREIRCQSALTPDGWISPARINIDDRGFISNVSHIENSPDGKTGAGHLIPGMPNLHSHAFQRQMAGSTETSSGQTDNFWTWREAMYRLSNRITPDQLCSIAGWLQAEMLEAGFTSCAEFHYVHHQPNGVPYDNPTEMSGSIVQAAQCSGISLTLLPVLYCRSGFASNEVSQWQKRFFNSPEDYLELLSQCEKLLAPIPHHHLGIAAHSLRAVSVDQLREVLDGSGMPGSPVHIHIAEQTAEVEECQSLFGARPVDYLLDHFAVDKYWCLVHATHLEDNELQRAAGSGAIAGLCPITEANLGDGFFPAENWLAAGGLFGLGSDSNIQLSVAAELRLLEYGCRLRTRSRNVLSLAGMSCGRSLYHNALMGGAAALGQKVGRIEPGYRADLVELDSEHPLLQGRETDSLLDSWLFAAGSSAVKSVWVGGTPLVRQGRHLNKPQLEPSFRQAMRELR